MAQYDLNLGDYERIFRKRYKMVVAILAMVMGFTLFFSHLKPSIYRASATVKVHRTSSIGIGQDMMSFAAWDNIETQTKVVRSFPVIMRAAIHMKRIPEEFLDQEAVKEPAVLGQISGLSSQLSVSVETGTNIIQISATSANATEAKELANAVADAYKAFALAEKRSQISKTRLFIETQLDKCRQELSESETRTRDFEQNQHLPKISDVIQRTINSLTKTESKIEDLNELDRRIATEMDRLNLRLSQPFGSLGSGPAKDSLSRPTNRKPTEMEWLSSDQTGSDQGFSNLNSRLIQYQLSMDDQMSFYKKDHPTIVDLEKRIQETIRQILVQLEVRRKEHQKQRAQLQAKLSDLNEDLGRLPSEEMEYARLVRQLRINEDLHSMLARKLQEAQIAEAGIVDDVTVMSYAPQPGGPINKNYGRILLIGLVLGILLGTILAIIREMLDTSIGTIEEVEKHLNVPVLAVIPHIQMDVQEEKLQKKFGDRTISHLHDRARLITQFDPKNPAAEAYRILRTNLHFLAADREVKVILVTSSAMQEGKSTTISNLAVALAQEGKKVLLVGCNLRRPSEYRIFGLPKGPGTADILIDRIGWRECVRTVSDIAVGEFNIEDILATPGIENLNIITFGQIPPNPSELISSSRMDTFLQEVRKEYDIVLVDSPPLLPVADGSLLATKTDGVVLVYQVGKAPRNSLWRGKERLESVKAKILGVVLNDIRPEISGASYVSQYYMHYYGEPTNRPKAKKPAAPAKLQSWSIWAGLTAGMSAGLPTLVERLGQLGQSTFLRILVAMGLLIPAGISVSNHLAPRFISGEKIMAYAAELIPSMKEPIAHESRKTTNVIRKMVPVTLDTFYTCQLSTWETADKALGVKQVLETRRIASWVDSFSAPDRNPVFRVCAGRFDSLPEARSYAVTHLEPDFEDFFYTRVARPRVQPARTAFVPKAIPQSKQGTLQAKQEPKTIAEATPSGIFYRVRFHSFETEQVAENACADLVRKGVPAIVVCADSPEKGSRYRVCSAPFSTKIAAEQFLGGIDRSIYRTAFISLHFSKSSDQPTAGG